MLVQNHFFTKRLDSLVFSAIHAIRTRSNLACELDAPFPAWEKPWRPPQWSQPKSQGMQNAGPIPPGRETADSMLTNTISIAGSPERSAGSDAATSGAARSRGEVTLPLLVRHGLPWPQGTSMYRQGFLGTRQGKHLTVPGSSFGLPWSNLGQFDILDIEHCHLVC